MSHLDPITPKPTAQAPVQFSLFGDLPPVSSKPPSKPVTTTIAVENFAKEIDAAALAECTEAARPTTHPKLATFVTPDLLKPRLKSAPLVSAPPVQEWTSPYPAEATRFLAGLLACIQADPALSKRKAADMASALRTVGKVLAKDLRSLPSDAGQLRILLAAAAPALAGITSDRWTRVRSLLLKALAIGGINVLPGRDGRGFSPAWQDLYGRLPDRKCQIGLSRFFSYCSREGLDPCAVSKQTFEDFRQVLLATSMRNNPYATSNTTYRLWNKAADVVTGWPLGPVSIPKDERKYSIPWTSFAPSFLVDVEAFLARSGDMDPFSDNYCVSVKPSTLASRRRSIHQIASALAASGTPAAEIRLLRDLVRPLSAKAALHHLRTKRGDKSSPYLAQQAQLLVTIGRHWCQASGEDIAALRGFATKLGVKRQGMTPKNRQALRQFDLPANVRSYLELPSKVLREVEKARKGDRPEALRVMLALAIQFLIHAPIRIDNLALIRLDRHLVEGRRGRDHSFHVVISVQETKTHVPIEFQIPPTAHRLLDAYLAKYRPILAADPGPWLFPNDGGQRRHATAFARAISNFLYAETGIKMTAHQFRHVAAKLYLKSHPGDVETVRRILGHTSIGHYAEVLRRTQL